jgi:peptide/nickel transport system permease protein
LKVGTGLLAAIVLAGLFAPVLTPYTLARIWRRPAAARHGPPFSTDNFGRDLCPGSLRNTRRSADRFFTTYVPLTYGIVLSALAGYFGLFDGSDAVSMSHGFSFLVLIIVIVAILGPGIQNIYIAIFLGLDHVCGSPVPRCWSSATRTMYWLRAISVTDRGASFSAMRFPM